MTFLTGYGISVGPAFERRMAARALAALMASLSALGFGLVRRRIGLCILEGSR
jgi:hypothetical protein